MGVGVDAFQPIVWQFLPNVGVLDLVDFGNNVSKVTPAERTQLQHCLGGEGGCKVGVVGKVIRAFFVLQDGRRPTPSVAVGVDAVEGRKDLQGPPRPFVGNRVGETFGLGKFQARCWTAENICPG